jgi:hypothetical protein
MSTSFVLHRVADYDAWRRVYDSVGEMQRQGGVTAEAVYRAESDPNNVLVMHRFGSADEAHSFFENPDLRQAMQDAGVDTGSLRIEFYNEG